MFVFIKDSKNKKNFDILKWYNKHKQEIIEYYKYDNFGYQSLLDSIKKYRGTHKEKNKEYKEKNKEEMRKHKKEYQRRYREMHKEEMREYQKEYQKKHYEKNKEKTRQRVKEYEKKRFEDPSYFVPKSSRQKKMKESQSKIKEIANELDSLGF